MLFAKPSDLGWAAQARLSLRRAMKTGDFCLVNSNDHCSSSKLTPIMLPWFIYLLILFGYLQTPEQWNALSPGEQQRLEIIINDIIEG